ncbi:MAG TPA: carbohydrate porin [Burkholderiales bacterium]|nr:carbohydrate porin [Burkholderiales bacterium]
MSLRKPIAIARPSRWAWRVFLVIVLPPISAGAAPTEAESWNLHFQATQVFQFKPSFGAAYTGANSLVPERERSRTTTATLFAGFRPWSGGEIYFNPEMAIGVPFSDMKGVGGFPNGEMQRTAGTDPTFYRARLFLRQTWGLGGGTAYRESDQNQLAGPVDSNRFVLTLGNIAVLDLFDGNDYSHDPRRSFMNWSLMTFGAWDYPADARGYTWGAAAEYIRPGWALRAGRFLQPRESNGLQLNPRIMDSYGDVVEYERAYRLSAQRGRIRLLAFRNEAGMGSFSAALAASGPAGAAPDLAATRAPRSKTGFGISAEHGLSDDVGLFLRASAHDGRTETYAFTEIDRSVSGGLVFKGARWQRAGDEAGVAFAVNGLSGSHRDYLARGGLGFFLGDGRLSYRSEQIAETYYSFKAGKFLWISFDYQHLRNPGYNADRGPVNFFGLRFHVEI